VPSKFPLKFQKNGVTKHDLLTFQLFVLDVV